MTCAGSAAHCILQIAAVNAWVEILSPAAKMRKTKASKSALAGLMLSLTLLSLFLSTVLPTNKLFFLAVSSVFTSVVQLECGQRWAWLLYIAASILALWLLPHRVLALAYVLFFGNWALVRSRIGQGRKYLTVIIKLCYFNLLFFVLYWLAKLLGFAIPRSNILLVLWLGSQVGMLLYDYAYDLFLGYYQARFQTK